MERACSPIFSTALSLIIAICISISYIARNSSVGAVKLEVYLALPSVILKSSINPFRAFLLLFHQVEEGTAFAKYLCY